MRNRRTSSTLGIGVAGVLTIALLASCGGGEQSPVVTRTGSGTVTMSDPPTCKVPIGDFVNVWVTVTKVRAHISSTADSNDGAWVDLVDRTSNPMQSDRPAIP